LRDDRIDWTVLMRAANAGDEAAYRRLLTNIAPTLRSMARRALSRAGQPLDLAEDIMQEILLAVHLKRHTFDPAAPFGPWLFAVARNKIIDALRRRGRRVFVPIEDFAETLPGESAEPAPLERDVERSLKDLPPRQQEVLRSIAVDGRSIHETGARLAMSDGAVRVALHRGLTGLAAKFRGNG
jgi:RNA polymerase sigma-70 factor (ECF subfamily)